MELEKGIGMNKLITSIFCVILPIFLMNSCRKEPPVDASAAMETQDTYTEDSSQERIRAVAGLCAQLHGLLSDVPQAEGGGGGEGVDSVIPLPLDQHAIAALGFQQLDGDGLYAVNFTGGGYSIASSVGMGAQVWAYFPTGSFDRRHLAECPPLVLLLERAAMQHLLSLNAFSELKKPWDIENPPPRFYWSDWIPVGPLEKEADKVEPMIPVVWGQRAPYNNFRADGAPAGCVATAVAQLLAYYRTPVGWQWDLMRKHHPRFAPTHKEPKAYAELSELFKELGDKLHMDYSANGSSADSRRIPGVLKSLGFNSGGAEVKYNYTQVDEEIGTGHPVPISAFEYRYEHSLFYPPIAWYTYDGGHEFLLDGLGHFRQQAIRIDRRTGEEVDRRWNHFSLVHANLGWDSESYNGYFNHEIFNTNRIPYPDRHSALRSGEDGVFQYEMFVLIGIRP